MTHLPRVLMMSRLPSSLEAFITELGYTCEAPDDREGEDADSPRFLCGLVSSEGAADEIAAWRADPATHAIPIFVVLERPDDEEFRSAASAGADDAILVHDLDGLARRLGTLAQAEVRRPPARGVALLVDPDPERRRRFGRALWRSGLTLKFASSLEEAKGSGDVAVAVVYHGLSDAEDAHHRLRETIKAHGLPVAVVTDGADPDWGGGRVERTATVPSTAPADHLLFVVNELLNPGVAEQRASPRLLYATLCAFRASGELVPSFGVTYNISRGGLFVRTLDLPAMGDMVWVELRPPHVDADACVHLRGTVAWRTVGGPTPPGFAVQLMAHRCPADDLTIYRERYRSLLDAPQRYGLAPLEEPGGTGVERTGAAQLLIADDDELVRRALARVFKDTGIDVMLAEDGEQAVELFRKHRHDVVIGDVNMPKLGGIELLKAIRADDEDVPVLITTGAPLLQSAIEAVANGAMRYMVKPVPTDELRDAVTAAIAMARLARFRRQAALAVAKLPSEIDEVGELDETLSRAIDKLYAHYQPIVRWPDREVIAFEALARTSEPKVPHPGVLFDAAERLKRLPDVARRMRALSPLPFADRTERLFINLHVADLLDEQLYDPKSPLAALGDQVVLELTERASLNAVGDLRDRVSRLRELGFRIAVDDLGAGYAGLSAFVALQPDVAKLDMSLIRDVHLSQTKQRLVRSMVSACDELSIQVVAEGVENFDELKCLSGLGCELFQGFFFARPAAPFPEVAWPDAE